jgi:thioredoxin-related protein
MLGPILKDVKENGKVYPSLKLMSIKNQQIAAQYQVRGVPTMILFQTENSCGDNLGFENDHQNHFREKQ